jgi:multiple sugar transport system ATP-binding protein
LDAALAAKAAGYVGKSVVFGIRPEDVHDALTATEPAPGCTVEVQVEVAEPMGAETYLYLSTGVTSFIARVGPTHRFEVDQKIKVTFALARAHLFDGATEQVLK